jgi:hypothetical protein
MRKLRLIALEDRIVYDGAVAHAVVQPTFAGADAHVSATSSVNDNSPTSPPNVLVVAQDLANQSLLVQAAKSNVKIVNYDPKNTTLPQLESLIQQALNGQKAGHIGFLTQGSEGNLRLLTELGVTGDSLQSASQSSSLLSFWRDISSNLLPDGSLDLFGSNIAKGDSGSLLINALKNILHSANPLQTVNASTGSTGAESLGGDWLLESGNVDGVSRYFLIHRFYSNGSIHLTLAPLFLR